MSKVLHKALDEYGIAEVSGTKYNKRVLDYFHETGHKWVTDDATAWCAAFANWVLKECGIQGSGKLNARSFLDTGREVKNPQQGDLVIFWRGSKSGWQGHVAFYITERDGFIYTLGGNQSDKVNISRYPKDRLLGYRRVETTQTNKVDFDIKKVTTKDLLTEVLLRIK